MVAYQGLGWRDTGRLYRTFSYACSLRFLHAINQTQAKTKSTYTMMQDDCIRFKITCLEMAVGKVPSGHTKPYPYPLGKN
jgi:hypothetical protein